MAIKIGGELTPASVAGILGDAKTIIDRKHGGKMQEDINTDVVDRISDKDFDVDSGKGLGRILLKKGKSLASQVTNTNTVYIIQDDLQIGGGSAKLNPADSMTIGSTSYFYTEVAVSAGETIAVGSSLIIAVQNSGYQWVSEGTSYTAQSDTVVRVCAIPYAVDKVDYTFTGQSTLTIPANCTLKFDGGSISGGTLVANGAKIEGVPSFNNMTDIQGVFKMDVVHAENFGFGGDDDTKLLGFLFDMAASGAKVVLEKDHQYETKADVWWRMASTYTVPVTFPEGYGGKAFFDDGHVIKYYNNLDKFVLDGNGATILESTGKKFLSSEWACPGLIRFFNCNNVSITNLTLTGDVCNIGVTGGWGVVSFFMDGITKNLTLDVKAKHIFYPLLYGGYYGTFSKKGLEDSYVKIEGEDLHYGCEINGSTNSKFDIKILNSHRGIYAAGFVNCDVKSVGHNVDTYALILVHAARYADSNGTSAYSIVASNNNSFYTEDDGTVENSTVSSSLYQSEGIGINNRFRNWPNSGQHHGEEHPDTRQSETYVEAGKVNFTSYDGDQDGGPYYRTYALESSNTIVAKIDSACKCRFIQAFTIGEFLSTRVESRAPFTKWNVNYTHIIDRSDDWSNLSTDNVVLNVYGQRDVTATMVGTIVCNRDDITCRFNMPPSNGKKVYIESSNTPIYLNPYAGAETAVRPNQFDPNDPTVPLNSIDDSAVFSIKNGTNVIIQDTPGSYATDKYTNFTIKGITGTIDNTARYPINIKVGYPSLMKSMERSSIFIDTPNSYTSIINSTQLGSMQPNRMYDIVLYLSANRTLSLPAPSATITLIGNTAKRASYLAGTHRFVIWCIFDGTNKKYYIEYCGQFMNYNAGETDSVITNAKSIINGRECRWDGSKWIEYDGAKAGVVRKGTTAQRPAGNDIYVGFEYFDTDLGKTVYASAIASSSPYTVTWVDTDGVIADVKKAGEITERPSTVGLKDGFTYLVTGQWTPTGGAAQDPGPIYYVDLTSAGGHPSWITVNGDIFEDTALPQRE